MRAIGLRAEPRGFSWAITEGTLQLPILIASGYVEVPKTFSISGGLQFLRAKLQHTLREDNVTHAGLRTPERLRAVTESVRERFRVEGVLLSSCAEIGLIVSQGPLATISSNLGVKSAKALLESNEYRGIDLSKLDKEMRESILMSASLLKDDNAGKD